MSRLPPLRALGLARALILLLLLTLAAPPASGQPLNSADLDRQLTAFEREVADIEGRLDSVSDEELTQLRRRLDEMRAAAAEMSSRVSPEIVDIRTWIDALGPPPEEGQEPPRIAGERRGLSQRLLNLDSAMRRADLLASKATTLSSKVLAESRERFGERILARGPPLAAPDAIVDSAAQFIEISTRLLPDLWAFLTREDITRALSGTIYVVGLALIVIGAGYIPLRRFQRAVIATPIRADTGIEEKAKRALREVFARSVLPLLLLLAVYAALRPAAEIAPSDASRIDAIMIGLSIVVLAYALATSALTPSRANHRLFDLPDEAARRWTVATIAFAVVFLLDQVRSIAGTVYVASFTSLALANAILVAIAAGLFIWAMWPRPHPAKPAEGESREVARPPLLSGMRLVSLIAVTLMAMAPFVALAGYFALSRYLASRLVLTTLVIAGLWLVYRIFSTLLRSAPRDRAPITSDEGKSDEGSDEVLSWWLSVATGAMLFVIGVAVIAILWGASAADFDQLREAIFEGFDFAGVRISLGQILVALLVFGIGLWITRLVQAAADRRVLPRLRLDMGARDSIRSALGYAGVLIAALVAIGITGLDLTNAAIIAGALSVGIGFGLQNVVNNFVSGLILLFERPFKVGDWIVVGGAEGTVRRIKVRATEIQTFDNATVIVPNSQFISGPVTNWMHKDTSGRVTISVKLGQRVEPEKVHELLLAIAHAHPDVTSYPPPTVTLLGFAGGLYEFELKAFVREVIKMASVKSDLNFTIVRQLHERGLWAPTP